MRMSVTVRCLMHVARGKGDDAQGVSAPATPPAGPGGLGSMTGRRKFRRFERKSFIVQLSFTARSSLSDGRSFSILVSSLGPYQMHIRPSLASYSSRFGLFHDPGDSD